MKNHLLNVVNLNKSFPSSQHLIRSFGFRKKNVVKVIDNVNFQLDIGEILVIAGESGSGKTTLARLIMKSIDQDSGKIIFDNEDISNLKGKELLRLRRKMQMILQDPYSSLDPRMKVFDIIKEPLQIHKKSLKKHEIREIIFSALKKVNLEPLEEISNKYPHMLSGGQRQRVSFARSLVLQPKLIIADEPVSMLDVSIRFQILELMRRLKEEVGDVLFSSAWRWLQALLPLSSLRRLHSHRVPIFFSSPASPATKTTPRTSPPGPASSSTPCSALCQSSCLASWRCGLSGRR